MLQSDRGIYNETKGALKKPADGGNSHHYYVNTSQDANFHPTIGWTQGLPGHGDGDDGTPGIEAASSR